MKKLLQKLFSTDNCKYAIVAADIKKILPNKGCLLCDQLKKFKNEVMK